MLARRKWFFGAAFFCCLTVLALGTASAQAPVPGTDTEGLGPSAVTFGSILPVVTETGLVSLSVDGLGVYPGNSGTIQVQKPAGATVRAAYLAAATTGFGDHKLVPSDITVDGASVGSWIYETQSSIYSWNYWADVTSLVKPKVDAAPAGRVDFTIAEPAADTYQIDGELLAVILNDPNQTTANTVVLLFGAQNVGGDTFNVALASPVNTADPNLVLDLGLGISYGFQPSPQYSLVDVNGVRMTSAAGGQDDGADENGALLTAGGLDDSNDNPADPYAGPTDPRSDDELYNLIPFVNDGDTTISVYTVNPSVDDNIFFASLFLTGEAIVGEGILLSPNAATNRVGQQHTLIALLQDDSGEPIVGRDVTFTVVSGPNAGVTHTDDTGPDGRAFFTYSSAAAGTDTIEASFVNSQGQVVTSSEVTKTWEEGPPSAVGGFAVGGIGAPGEGERAVRRVASGDATSIALGVLAVLVVGVALLRIDR